MVRFLSCYRPSDYRPSEPVEESGSPKPVGCGLDHAPSLADRFIVGIAPVDSDPVVLLKPFGPRLAADALPSEDSPMAAPGQPIRVPAFAVVPH